MRVAGLTKMALGPVRGQLTGTSLEKMDASGCSSSAKDMQRIAEKLEAAEEARSSTTSPQRQ